MMSQLPKVDKDTNIPYTQTEINRWVTDVKSINRPLCQSLSDGTSQVVIGSTLSVWYTF